MHAVETAVTLHDSLREGHVTTGDGFHGVSDLCLGQTAHAGDLGGQLVQLVPVGLDGVLVHQPKRPVM